VGSEARRCLLVASVFPPVTGGSASVYASLARYAGGRISVLAPLINYMTGRELERCAAFDAAAPYTVHRVKLLRTVFPPQMRWRNRIAQAVQDVVVRGQVVAAIHRIVRTENITTLCIGELVAGGWLVRVARLLRLSSIVYVHGEEVSITDSYDPDRRRRRATLAAADSVVAVSEFTKTALIALMQVDPRKITLIPNGVDLSRFSPRARRADLLARYGLGGKRVLLTLGRLSPRKGQDKVIETLPALCATFPDLVYLLAGDGPSRDLLASRAEALGIRDRVVFAGSIPDHEVADTYALADVFIMANRTLPDGETEGFGLVFLEANACGVPVIAGRAGGSQDAVTDGVNGLTVDGEDEAMIAGAISRLLTDARLREVLIAQGLHKAAASAWPARAASFLALV
jgi:phosphatidylinositol alpha-1,6-mannosyltransferase